MTYLYNLWIKTYATGHETWRQNANNFKLKTSNIIHERQMILMFKSHSCACFQWRGMMKFPFKDGAYDIRTFQGISRFSEFGISKIFCDLTWRLQRLRLRLLLRLLVWYSIPGCNDVDCCLLTAAFRILYAFRRMAKFWQWPRRKQRKRDLEGIIYLLFSSNSKNIYLEIEQPQ